MKNMSNEQFEHEMNIISNLKEVGAPNFFYTRLKSRMEKEKLSNELANPLKPGRLLETSHRREWDL